MSACIDTLCLFMVWDERVLVYHNGESEATRLQIARTYIDLKLSYGKSIYRRDEGIECMPAKLLRGNEILPGNDVGASAS